MAKHQHLSLAERRQIEASLKCNLSFKAIARALGRDPSTIAKEIRSHLLFRKTDAWSYSFNDCQNRRDCTLHSLCQPIPPNCTGKACRFCGRCRRFCTSYAKEECPRLLKPPYVCNGCNRSSRCSLEKRHYLAHQAQKEYEAVRSESRSGFAISEAEALALDAFLSPLILRGQSIHHICTQHKDEILFSEKCLYNYLDQGLFSAKNLDLPRKVRYRPRKSRHDAFKVDKTCRMGRCYQDFLAFREQNPDLPLVQIDSVIGRVGGKVLLTLHFVQAGFMLAFLRERNDSQSVIDTFNLLEQRLGLALFRGLFPCLLADNGSEFSNPLAIETNARGEARCRLFYCDKASPHQRAEAENQHALIRRILPKGSSFDGLTQEDIDRMMHHIQSYRRKQFGDRSPHEVFRLFFGEETLAKLGALLIPPDDVMLRPALLKIR